MSKIKQKSAGLIDLKRSSNSMIGRALRSVPSFEKHLRKFEQQIVIGGYSESSLKNYAQSVARICLHFERSPLELDDDEINAYLFELSLGEKTSNSVFKHMVYGLRFFFRVYGREDRAIALPPLKPVKSLPVVLSRKELRALFAAPQRLKHRVLFALIYSAGLRVGEVCRLKIKDIDSERMQIRVHRGKGNKDRYVPLSPYILQGLRKYFLSSRPVEYLFNGRKKGNPLGESAVQSSFRLAVKKAGVLKDATVHTLRHSFATHLLEDGLDIVSIKELLGHSKIETTMIYLHVARFERVKKHSPLDNLYTQGAAKA